MTYTAERGEYKGHPTLTIKDGNGRNVLTFGARKAEAIIAVWDEIDEFVADATADKEVTAP